MTNDSGSEATAATMTTTTIEKKKTDANSEFVLRVRCCFFPFGVAIDKRCAVSDDRRRVAYFYDCESESVRARVFVRADACVCGLCVGVVVCVCVQPRSAISTMGRRTR